MTLSPVATVAASRTNAPWALMATVSVDSSNFLFSGSWPRISTPTCTRTRWLRRRLAPPDPIVEELLIISKYTRSDKNRREPLNHATARKLLIVMSREVLVKPRKYLIQAP